MIKINNKKLNIAKKNIVPIFLIIFLLITSFISYKFFSIGKTVLKITATNTSLLGQIHNFAIPNKKLKGENEKRTNILLLGVGGEGHEGELLTDTIIVFSINYEKEKPKVALISIPRDLYINLEKFGNTKINSLYALDKNNPDSDRIVKGIENITGLTIHYYIQADFEGFQKAIDAINGIDIDIEHSFIDSKYPTDDFGYQTISFEQGKNHMDGDTALKYSRSRYGIVTDDSGAFEANDAARAKRQQQILYASKEKLMSFGTIINPKKINELLNILGDHIRTNLQLWEIIKLGELAKNIDTQEIKNNVLDDSPNGLLYHSEAPDGSFIFLPKSNNFSEIHRFCQNIFKPEKEKIETANIKLLNGTNIPNLAQEASTMILYENIKILAIDNAQKTNYNKTLVYDYSNNAKPNTIEFLKDRFDAKIIKSSTPPEEFKDKENQVDIIMIIGKNFTKLPKYEY